MHRVAILILLCGIAAAGSTGAERKQAQPRGPAMTIDVKDADVRDILRELKRQCGIRNLIIDKDVAGSGTFLFRNVPCPQAIRTITASLGLDYEVENAYVRVAARK
jgi:type II secretory pathway component HofQ